MESELLTVQTFSETKKGSQRCAALSKLQKSRKAQTRNYKATDGEHCFI